MFTTNGTYPWSLMTQIFHNGQTSHGGDRNTFEVMTSTLLRGTIGSVASLLAAILYQGNPYRNHKRTSMFVLSFINFYVYYILIDLNKQHVSFISLYR